MRSPEALRARLRATWRSRHRSWLGGGGVWPHDLPVPRPSGEAILRDWAGFDAWLRAWQAIDDAGIGEVEWDVVTPRRVGPQRVPMRWHFADACAVAAAVGEAQAWARADVRFRMLRARWSGLAPDPARLDAALRRSSAALAEYADDDFARLADVVDWLCRHPQSGLFERQLPVEGIDSKWLGRRRGLVRDWVAAVRGLDPGLDFHAVTGLRPPPARMRLRLLDPALRAAAGGLGDIESPVAELAALAIDPACVVVVENRDTGLAFEDVEGVAVLMSRGYAVDVVERLPWLAAARIVYWGDIDTHGLAILARLRARLPDVRAVLMDEDTFLAHRILWSEEVAPDRVSAHPTLRPEEARLHADLLHGRWGPGRRLEQERIPWDHAWPRIVAALGEG
ncbi:Wadjet anti-phage system protein JetD domain-containing protein [Coralloluteibacterium thermophilus]|uniref:Wadjet anti-phage system protein JetD domain-containing protein n=1 Tax=Coralloluteibacterium thermophilum TaxID=2707049 RepID=A0ABV9NJH6_9GAMM